jgi:hypothetical protein
VNSAVRYDGALVERSAPLARLCHMSTHVTGAVRNSDTADPTSGEGGMRTSGTGQGRKTAWVNG